MSRATAALLCSGWLACAAPARAHGDLHDQIESLTAALREDPNSAELYHKRGELERAHGDHAAALADYRRAQRLDPALHVVRLSRGRTLLESGKAHAAERALAAFLQRSGEHAAARLLHARALASLGRRAEAEAAYARALAQVADPLPDLFLERARNLALGGKAAAALAVLEDGLRRLGPLVTLQDAALVLELDLGRLDAALARLEAMLATAPRKEALLARKAAILERAGRREQAGAVRAQALAALDALPPPKRALAATQKLRAELLGQGRGTRH